MHEATLERRGSDVLSVMRSLLFRFIFLALGAVFPHWVVAAGEAPLEPQNLTGLIDENTVSLQWEASTDADDTVEGYNVYRNNAYLSTVFDNQYTGQIEPDTLYSFYVVAFDEAPRRFSQPSQSIALPQSLVPSDLTIPPTVPEDLAGEIDGTAVSIRWAASTDDEAVLGYNVYRNNQYLTTVSGTEYSSEIAAGESVSFYIVAFDIRRNFSQRSSLSRYRIVVQLIQQLALSPPMAS